MSLLILLFKHFAVNFSSGDNFIDQVWWSSFLENCSDGLCLNLFFRLPMKSRSADFLCEAGPGPAGAASLPDLSHLSLSYSNQAIFLCPEQTRPTLMPTCRAHRRTARMNWWVSIRRRSAAPKASGEEPRRPLTPSTQEVSGGRAGRSTALWLLTMTATAAKPRLMTVGSVSVTDLEKLPARIHRQRHFSVF